LGSGEDLVTDGWPNVTDHASTLNLQSKESDFHIEVLDRVSLGSSTDDHHRKDRIFDFWLALHIGNCRGCDIVVKASRISTIGRSGIGKNATNKLRLVRVFVIQFTYFSL
jgi:hypothetical protein